MEETNLEKDSKQAREENHEKEAVPKLGSSLKVDAPISSGG